MALCKQLQSIVSETGGGFEKEQFACLPAERFNSDLKLLNNASENEQRRESLNFGNYSKVTSGKRKLHKREN